MSYFPAGDVSAHMLGELRVGDAELGGVLFVYGREVNAGIERLADRRGKGEDRGSAAQLSSLVSWCPHYAAHALVGCIKYKD